MAFEFNEEEEVVSQINITPLVDVMLVLMVIFLITAPVLNTSITLDLPKEKGAVLQEDGKEIIIIVKNNGDYYFNKTLVSKALLENEISKVSKQAQVLIKAEKETSFKNVSYVLAPLQAFGVEKIGFVNVLK